MTNLEFGPVRPGEDVLPLQVSGRPGVLLREGVGGPVAPAGRAARVGTGR